MLKKEEKQVLNLELYKELIKENSEMRIFLKENQQNQIQTLEGINKDINLIENEIKIAKGKLKINKRALKKEHIILIKNNKKLKKLNKKDNKLNRLFSNNKEKSVRKLNFVLTKK